METYDEENSRSIECGVTDDTFISPYNSPEKDYAFGSGDYNPVTAKEAESDHSVENNHTLVLESNFKGTTSFGSEMLTELKKVSQTNERSCLFAGDAQAPDYIKSDSGIALTDEKSADRAENFEGRNETQQDEEGSHEKSKELPLTKSHEQSPNSRVSSPEEEKEKIIAEMLATAGEARPNEVLTQSEMMSISKKMEEEFRTMVIEEQQKKKLMTEGVTRNGGDLSHTTTPVSTVSEPAAEHSSEAAPSKALTRSTKTTPTSRLPITQLKIGRPSSARKATTPTSTTPAVKTGFTASPTRQPLVSLTKPRSTPTTIRVQPKAGSPITNSSAVLSSSAREQRTPLQPTSLRIKTQSKIPAGTTPVKATLRSPRSGPFVRTPTPNLSTPRQRTPSSQSSEGGRARMPDTRKVQSKIGSLQNAKHIPGGGKVKIETKKEDYSKVTSKIGSKANLNHTPTGGKVKIESKKLDYSNVGSRCESLANAKHTPGGGKQVKVESKRLDFSHVRSKCGSLDNATHTPGGGRVKVESKKLDYGKVSSKCGSKDNLKHTPKGGNGKIFSGKVDTSKVQSKIGSKDNINHTPGGGNVKIVNKTIELSHVKPKCGSLDNANYVPGGGNVQIFDEVPMFKETAKPKIGSLENAGYVSKGGDVRIYDEKLQFRESAFPRTDTGVNGFESQRSSGGSVSST